MEIRSRRRYWDPAEIPWLAPLADAAPEMARELAAARGDSPHALVPGQAVDAFFDDGTTEPAAVEGVRDRVCSVRYDDGEVEELDASRVGARCGN